MIIGLGNWQDVSDHVGSKTKMKCENHYIRDFLESPTTPLPVRARACDLVARNMLSDARVEVSSTAEFKQLSSLF